MNLGEYPVKFGVLGIDDCQASQTQVTAVIAGQGIW